MPVEIAPEVASKLRLGVLALEDLTVRESDPALTARLAALAESLRTRYGGQEVSAIPGVAAARALYHAVGMDPTRRRPSSEALLRRALRGQPLPQINTLVDVNNLISLRHLLPIGLYDRDQIRGGVVARLGRPGEPYEAIGREEFSVEGRLVLADDFGPFGSPTSDSVRTMITLATRRALAVIFAPADFDPVALRRAVDDFAAEALAFNGGRVAEATVLP